MNITQEKFANLSRKELIRTLRRLGFIILTDRGKGGHYLAKLPATKASSKSSASITIGSKVHNIINKKIYKQVKACGFSDDEIDEAMG